jgi:hypothetical protein
MERLWAILGRLPALSWPVLFYALINLFGYPNGIVSGGGPALALPLPSGDTLRIGIQQIYLLSVLAAAAIDLLVAALPSPASLARLVGAGLLGTVGLILMLLVKGFGDALFLLVVVASFTTFAVGAAIATTSARRDVGVASTPREGEA